MANEVYSILFSTCSAVYNIGQTGHLLKTRDRLDEHKTAVNPAKYDTSVVAEHVWKHQHQMDSIPIAIGEWTTSTLHIGALAYTKLLHYQQRKGVSMLFTTVCFKIAYLFLFLFSFLSLSLYLIFLYACLAGYFGIFCIPKFSSFK